MFALIAWCVSGTPPKDPCEAGWPFGRGAVFLGERRRFGVSFACLLQAGSRRAGFPCRADPWAARRLKC